MEKQGNSGVLEINYTQRNLFDVSLSVDLDNYGLQLTKTQNSVYLKT